MAEKVNEALEEGEIEQIVASDLFEDLGFGAADILADLLELGASLHLLEVLDGDLVFFIQVFRVK